MGVSWLSSVTLGSLEACHFERTVAYLAWETRSNSLYLEKKSKNKRLMPVSCNNSKHTAEFRKVQPESGTLQIALFCVYSHCIIAVLVKIWFIISCWKSWPLLEDLFESCRTFCACSAWGSATHPWHSWPRSQPRPMPVQRNMPTTSATYTPNWLKGSVNFLINVFFMPSSGFFFQYSSLLKLIWVQRLYITLHL